MGARKPNSKPRTHSPVTKISEGALTGPIPSALPARTLNRYSVDGLSPEAVTIGEGNKGAVVLELSTSAPPEGVMKADPGRETGDHSLTIP